MSKKYQPTYWNHKGKYQKEYEMLSDILIPVIGDAITKQGQLLRCVSNFYHQRYNNGFGNPVGQYTAYVRKYAKSHKLKIGIVKDMTEYALDREIDKVIKHLSATLLEPLGDKDKV